MGRGLTNYLCGLVSSRTGVPIRPLRWLLAALAAVAVVLVGWSPSPAAAQGLEESTPSDGDSLPAPPTEIVLRFDEPITNQLLLVGVCNSNPYELPSPVLSADARTVTLALLSPTPQGTCTIRYTATAADSGDSEDGTFSFSVEESPVTSPTVPGQTTTTAPTTTTAAGDADDDGEAGSTEPPLLDASTITDGPTWLGRMLSTLGLAVLFGSLVLIVAAWPEGPEYILAVRFLRSVWILAALGSLLYVVSLSAGVNEESLGSGLNPSSWLDLVDAGWSGRAALARLVLTLLCGWVVSRPERVIDPTTQLPAIVIPTLAVATIGLSRTGGDLEILGVFAAIAHALAMAIWFGAVVLLTRVVLAGPGDEDLVHAVRGFGRISHPAILVTVITGFIQLFRLDGGNVFTTGHGRLLLLKAVAVAAMVFVGMTTRQVASHRLARASDLSPGTSDNLRRAFGTEAMIGVVVLAASAGLMSFVPAKSPVSQVERFAVNIAFVDEASGVDIDVRLQPGQVGVNRLRVEVNSPDAGLTGLQVAFIPPADSGQPAIEQDLPGLTGAPGQDIADTTPNAGIPLQVAGTWTVELTGSTATGALSPFVQRFDVREADGTIASSDIGSVPAPSAVTSAPTTSSSTTAAP